ncbi:MAG TPA: LysR family transcriptional regulator, partial [Thalassospira sp.]|nr:LysR family transcriptional regulator [Thalassospira sp.]
PDYYVDPWIASGDLVPVLTKYQPSDEGIWAIYPTNRHLSPKIRMLVEHLGRYLG